MPLMKTMLLTGASSGIGRALAVRAARAGYAVYAVGRNREALETLRTKIEAENGFVAVDATDIAIAANARGLVERTLGRFGSIDVLVNNAGFVSAGPLCAQDDAELQRQFGTHVIGPVALVREALDALRRARGHVFMLGSGVARVPVGGLGAYPPAKAAIRSATAILRRELRPEGIAVTYVDPGAVDTPFMKRAGMPGAPASVLVSPEAVARKILIAIGTGPRELNAVGWQTAAVGLAALFPRLTDALLERTPALVGGAVPDEAMIPPAPKESMTADESAAFPQHIAQAVAAAEDGAQLSSAPEPIAEAVVVPEPLAGAEFAGAAVAPPSHNSEPVAEIPASPFEAALEPHRRRMEKLKLRLSFVRDLLVADATLDTGDVALRWAGMPNKHERAITEDVLAALADAGFLERAADSAYRVVRLP